MTRVQRVWVRKGTVTIVKKTVNGSTVVSGTMLMHSRMRVKQRSYEFLNLGPEDFTLLPRMYLDNDYPSLCGRQLAVARSIFRHQSCTCTVSRMCCNNLLDCVYTQPPCSKLLDVKATLLSAPEDDDRRIPRPWRSTYLPLNKSLTSS